MKGNDMSDFKKVTEKEFKKFIEDYPRPLELDCFMGWLEYFDFPKGIQPKSLEELFSYKVARVYRGYGDDEYFIKDGVE